MMTRTIQIFDVDVHPCSVQDLHQEIESLIQNNAHALILNVNVHCLNLAYERPWLRQFLNSADVNFCDGAGVILGARILGETIPARITYADWIWQLAEFADDRGYSFYFLGAKPGVAAAAANKLKTRFPKLEIIGWHHGHFDLSVDSDENKSVIEEINLLRPNILVLGLGMPLQEQWLMENWSHIKANVALTGGAVFDYVSGDLRRAPDWVTNNGFEWLGRLAIEPQRLWRRYLVGNPLFMWRVLRQRFAQRSINKNEAGTPVDLG